MAESLILTPMRPTGLLRSRLLRRRLQQKVLGELHVDASHGSLDRAQIAAVFIVADSVAAAVEAADLDLALILRCVKGVVHAAPFTNGVGLRAVEANIVQIAAIFALGLLSLGVILVTCYCSNHLSEEALLELVAQASLDANRTLRVLERRIQSQDHPILLTVPETLYLKCLILEVV